MKKHILLAAAVLSAFMLKAGDLNLNYHGGGSSDSKFSIGLSVGAALPLGAFGGKTKPSDTATSSTAYTVKNGFASTGFHFDLNAGYLIAGPVGAMVFIGGNLNAFDATTFSSVYNIKSPETYTATSYYTGQYMVGPFLSFGDKFKFDVRLLVGLVTVSPPKTTDSYTAFGSTSTTVTTTNPSSGFGYQGGIGIKYNFSDKMGFTVDVAYTGNAASFPGSSSTTTVGSSSSSSTSSSVGSMSLGILTTSIGLAFNL
jgi:hypothetical protein